MDQPGPLRHIVLMGLMGTGKTTTGRVLAGRLDWPMRDSDEAIEAATGRSVRELRDEIGTDAMHDLEATALLRALEAPGPASSARPRAPSTATTAARHSADRVSPPSG